MTEKLRERFEGESFGECTEQYFAFAAQHPEKSFETVECGFVREDTESPAVHHLVVEEKFHNEEA